jgi:membrane protease YdiL (CAAX protease family)
MYGIVGFIKRNPQITFWAISYLTFFGGFALLVAFPGIIPEDLWFIFIWGTALGALFVVSITEGWAGVKTWASRIFRWRVGLIWYVVVLCLTPLMRLAAFGLNLALGAPTPAPEAWAGFAEVPMAFVFIFFTIGIGEELGFRGYALPKLMEKHSPLVASLILGVLRVIWHAPLFLFGDSLWVILMVIFGDVIFTWVFQNTRGSVLMALLLHSVFNASGSIFFPLFEGASAEQQTMLLAVVFVVVASVIALVTGPNLTRRRVEAAPRMPVAAPASAK